MIYNIPIGPKNLESVYPLVDFSQVEEYYVTVVADDDTVIATSRVHEMEKCDEVIVLHFVNQLGGIDSIPLRLTDGQTESKSDIVHTPVTSPFNKNVHAINRTNIRYNHSYKAEIELTEEGALWIMELFGSPFVWMEWEGTQNQPDDYIPVVLIDKKVQHRKDTERFSYVIEVDFMLSHENMSPRG